MWTDSQGRDWSTAINVNAVRRVKDRCDVLLTDCADGDLFIRLKTDVLLLCDVLYAVCEPQATKRDLSATAFGELLAGETIDKAEESLSQDILDFFPKCRRETAARLLMVATRTEAERINLLDRKIPPEILERLIQESLEKASNQIDEYLAQPGVPSGKSPESSESTQGL